MFLFSLPAEISSKLIHILECFCKCFVTLLIAMNDVMLNKTQTVCLSVFPGKYVGNRPIKLRKSTWKDRSIDIVRKKEKEKKRLGLRWHRWLIISHFVGVESLLELLDPTHHLKLYQKQCLFYRFVLFYFSGLQFSKKLVCMLDLNEVEHCCFVS